MQKNWEKKREKKKENYVCTKNWFWLSCLAPLVFLILNIFFNYLALQSFDIESTWWRLFQKCVVHTKLDIFFFLLNERSPSECEILCFLENIQGRNYNYTNQLSLERRFLCDFSTYQMEVLELHNLKGQIVQIMLFLMVGEYIC
jgi:hypothetical protein